MHSDARGVSSLAHKSRRLRPLRTKRRRRHKLYEINVLMEGIRLKSLCRQKNSGPFAHLITYLIPNPMALY